MPGDDPQQGFRRARRQASPLLPLLQGAGGDAQRRRKLRLGQARAKTGLDYVVNRHLELSANLSGLELLESLNQLLANVAAGIANRKGPLYSRHFSSSNSLLSTSADSESRADLEYRVSNITVPAFGLIA